MSSIKNSVNIITGCGSGLGKATLQWFLRRGSGPVLGIDRRVPKEFVDQLDLTDAQKNNLVLKEHDTFNDDIEGTLKEFRRKYGVIDNLINIAGVALAFTLATESGQVYKLDHARDLVQFNTVGTFNMIRMASQFMIDEKIEPEKLGKTRCIVNTSCISTTKPSVGQTFYTASKSAIDSMTLGVARDLSQHSIRCNTINVGYFDTPLLRGSSDNICDYLGLEVTLCPKRLGQPDEFAHLVQSIVENQMINGACIKLDGCAEPAQDRPSGKMS